MRDTARPLATSAEEVHQRVLEAARDGDIAYLVKSLKDRTQYGDPPLLIRRVAARHLGNLGHPGAIPALTQLLQDPDMHARIAAARALGKIGTPHAVTPLIEATGDPVWQVREFAAAALGRIGDSRAVPAVAALLADEREQTRRLAARALADLRDWEALPALEHARQSCGWWEGRHYRRAIRTIREHYDALT